MLTKEKREKLRFRCTRLDRIPNINTTLEMLDMIDSLETEVSHLTAERDAAVKDIYHMGGCPNCKKNFGQNENTGLPKCAEHRDFPNGDCFEWRGVAGRKE